MEAISTQPYAPSALSAVTTPSVAPATREIPFRFSGKASEYFRIWIVNTLLTLVTLGIYSAWAKVRKEQYFYRHTSLDGSSFEYLANPVSILKGRLIAAAAFGLLFAAHHYSLKLYLGLALALGSVMPWVWVKALAFKARNSSFRNIRFAFTGRTGEAMGECFRAALFVLLTCGIAYPYAVWRLTRFAVGRHFYGDRQFRWHGKARDYFVAYCIAFALLFAAYVALIGGFFGSGWAKNFSTPVERMQVTVLASAFLYVYWLIPAAFLRARLSNLLYGGIRLGEHALVSKQRWVEILKLYATNFVAIVFSFGLLIPWANVRLAAYRASALSLVASGAPYAESLLDDEPGALGQGLNDLGNFDIGLGT